MNMKASNVLGLVTVCGLAATSALAQPSVINISGASLLENYVRSPASTNDFIDVDGNGVAGSLGSPSVQQLATTTSGGAFSPALKWIVQYRVTGSVNGLKELIQFGSPFLATGNDSNATGILGQRPSAGVLGDATTAYQNRVTYIAAGANTGVYNQGNPGGAPYTADLTTSASLALWAAAPTSSGGAVRIDVAPLDIPTTWAVQTAGTPQFNDRPQLPGYGTNPRRSVNRQGTLTGFANLPNDLALLGNRTIYTGNPASATTNTLFDTQLSYAVIVPVVNQGTGITQLTMTEMRHMFVTGRTITGENLTIVTRSAGSGTRNAWSNNLGLDPSWTVGDNVGGESTLTVNNLAGIAFTSTNKNATGGVEVTMRNARLAVAYLGGERGPSGSGSQGWLINSSGAQNPVEIPAVRNDIYPGSTNFIRPTIGNIIGTNVTANGGNNWVLGGPAVLVTVGDPNAEPIALGGQGLSTPRMTNIAAAAYLNNTIRSITNFISVPTDVGNLGMPGEFAATQFTLTSALNLIPSALEATTLISNPNLSAGVQTYTLNNSIYANGRYATADFSHAGRVPTRTTGVVYTDGVANGGTYITQSSATLAFGSNMPLRNKIAGDFDGNGLRNINDTAQMLRAYNSRNGGATWTAPAGTGSIAGAAAGDACIELLGDFDVDGSFTAADVRYFADGLAIATTGPRAGKLDRKAGFIAIDTQWLALTVTDGNFFDTTLATGAAYTPGASRGDVAGPSGANARGWAPVGNDGVINAFDIDFVFAQFARNATAISGQVSWTNLAQAATFDLSADMTGDLIVDIADITELLTILGTSMGDVNLDGQVNAADLAIVSANLNTAGGWARGDLNGDGQITSADFDVLNAILNPPVICLADVAGGGPNADQPDGIIDGTDFVAFINSFGVGDATVSSVADVAGGGPNADQPDGIVDGNDFVAFINAFSAGC